MKGVSKSVLAFLFLFGLILTACAPPEESSSEGANQGNKDHSDVTLTIATVNNPDMKSMQDLTSEFTDKTGIKVKYVVLPENELRKKVTEDVALGAGKFDIATIGTYDAPIWAKNKWLISLDDYFDKMSDEEKSNYDLDDIFAPIKNALSYNDHLYALPFYGESSMLYYNKDIMKAAGVSMPLHPTWQQVADAAVKIKEKTGKTGIVLRGLPGWGEMMAPLDTVINAFGGKWYDENWKAQLTNPQTEKAVQFYVDLLHKAGESGATSTGYTEALTLMSQGKAGMWYDATAGAGNLNDKDNSNIVGKVGYAYAPTADKKNTGWLYAWSLGIEKSSKHKAAAFKFLTWATSKDYVKLVGDKKGWVVAPPGTRKSTYENPDYKKAAPFADIVRDSLEHADYDHPTIDPVPYKGVQYVEIPEFSGLGTEVSQQIASAISGDKSVKSALAASQKLAEQAAEKGGYKK
ncbi:sugar ABC transporter substrate-binding protein [Pullulanibacillus camelliae]|uniref:Sugar ABC transporter substrate-binding protein n=1 Tax=Pullulanibacillus camelliae TaxID=1707096 RepID=A0A8J2VL05_9BACL|nr:sugar ABC transporter substrate-binding protein [Pullulanibacillus camelliae]GGE29613.1 sugar ABC transporter substrate-binding protein [Pullulanibacillus camelliae]